MSSAFTCDRVDGAFLSMVTECTNEDEGSASEVPPVCDERFTSIPASTLASWQSIVDAMASLAKVPASLIMRIRDENIEVLAASRSEDNPYRPGNSEHLLRSGLYCEAVITSGDPLLVPDARDDDDWKTNPDIRLNMISYLGYPIVWPDRQPFGTICVLDTKPNSHSDVHKDLLKQFRDIIEHHLQLVFVDTNRQRELLFDRSAHELALRHSEQRFRFLAEHAADDFILHDADGRILDANRQACRNLGSTREEMLRKSVDDLPISLETPWGAREWAFAEADGNAIIQGTYRHADGRRVPVEIRWSCQVLDGEKLFLGLFRDVSERVEAERMLLAREAALSEGQRISRTGSWRWSTSTGDFITSAEACRILDPTGSRPPQDIGDVIATVDAADRHYVDHALKEALASRTRFRFECRLSHPSSHTTHVQAIGHPLIGERGELEYVGTLAEITERKEAEEQIRAARAELARASRLTSMGQLAGSIVHEINQPLTSIVTSAEACLRWLDRDEPDWGEVRSAVERLRDQGQRAADVVAGLRSLARKASAERRRFDLNALVRDVVELARQELDANAIDAQLQLKAGNLWVSGDPVQLKQVVLNLILNAVEAMAEVEGRPRTLRIVTGVADSGDALVRIDDSGIGFDEETRRQLFDSLFTTKSHGMGLGLSICRSIVRAHGRTIDAVARSDGPGASFYFSLPEG